MKSLHHSFDIDLAVKYGRDEAIIIHHFQHWIRINKKLKKNFIQGRTWTYQTIEEIAAHFPYFSLDEVRGIVQKLCTGISRRSKKGDPDYEPVLMKGNFNKTPFDKTSWYAFVDEGQFSNNVYEREISQIATGDLPIGEGRPPRPIPDTIKDTENTTSYEVEKKKNSKKRKSVADPSPVIKFNRETSQFEGITEQDIRDWRKAHPSVNVLKVIDEATNWAKSNPREHYRISLNTFMKNTEMKHTTPWKPPIESQEIYSPEDVQINKNCAEQWELIYNKKRIQNYDIHSKPSKVLFLFPNNETHEVSYLCSHMKFVKDCQPFILRLKLGEK